MRKGNNSNANNDNNSQSSNKTKQVIKEYIHSIGIRLLIIALPIIILLLAISLFTWYINVEEGTWKEDEKGRPSTYTKTAEVSGEAGISVDKRKLVEQGLRDMEFTDDEILTLTDEDIIRILKVYDKLGKTITSIDELTHAEILWCTNDVYKKYLEKPEDLQRILDAELITQYPKIDGLSADKLNGIVEFIRYTTDPDTQVETETTLKWISEEQFAEKMAKYEENGNTDILNYFTLDGDGNIKIATWKRETGEFYSNDTTFQTDREKIRGGVTPSEITSKYDTRYSVTANSMNSIEASYVTYTIQEQTINYKMLIQKYTLPFEYIWSLLVITESDEVALDLAELAYNSQIQIGIYDNINKVVNTNTETYREEFREKSETYKDGELSSRDPSDGGWNTEGYDYEIRNTVTTYTNTIQCEVKYANTWIVEVSTEYANTVKVEEVTTDTNSVDDEDWSDNISPNPTVEEWTERETIPPDPTDPTDHGHTSTHSYKSYLYKDKKTISHNYVSTLEPTISEYQRIPPEEPRLKVDTDENTDDNFIKIMRRDENAITSLTDLGSVKWLMEMLENNNDTVNMINLTKQLLYILTENSNYDVDFDFDYFLTNPYTAYNSSSSLIVKTDISGAAPTVEKSKLESGIKNWVSGEQQANALSVLDKVIEIEENYKVNAVFIYALLQQESGIGTADSTWVAENNWTSLTALGHRYYETPQENLDKFVTSTICGSYYFNVGRYSVHQIGEVYCADPPPPVWADGVVEKMLALYHSCGLEVELGNGNSEVIDVALSKLGSPYVWGNKGPTSFDCSGFVYWCFKQIGISVPASTSAYSSYRGTANEISLSEIQPGDILHRFAGELGKETGHVAIYLGNGEYIHAAGEKWGVIKGSNINSSFVRAFRFTE